MSAALRYEHCEAPGDALVHWSNDDLSRAILLFANSREEARHADARCAELATPASHSAWRKPLPREALRQRTIARIRFQLARRFLLTALAEWRPLVGGGH